MNVTYLIQNVVLMLGFGAAAVLTLTARKRFPRSAMLAAGGFAALLAGVVFSTIVSFVPLDGFPLSEFTYPVSVVVYTLCTLLGTALLVLAVLKKDDATGAPPPAGPHAGTQWQQQHPGY